MAPTTTKKKGATADDVRSPIENALLAAQDQLKVCEAQVAAFREGVQDLSVHTLKIKTLEHDLGPKENELRNTLSQFQRLVDSSVSIKRGSGDAAAESTVAPIATAGVRSLLATSSTRLTGSPYQHRASSAPIPTGSIVAPSPAHAEEDAKDREYLKALGAALKEQLVPVLSRLFHQPQTALEAQVEELKAKEASDLAASMATPARPSGRNRGGGGGGPSTADLQARPDPELFRPPGIDPPVYLEVLRLRAQRLAAERQLNLLQEQLVQSKQLVARRTAEGASKTALKKAEKQLEALTATVRELTKQKEDYEIRKRSETPVPNNNSRQGRKPR